MIERCEHLEELDVSHTKIKEFPTVIFKMKNLQIVIVNNVSIQVLDEDFVKLWSQRPEIFTKGRFLKVVGDNLEHFVKPPREIVRRGPEACLKYYRALKLGNTEYVFLWSYRISPSIVQTQFPENIRYWMD